MNSIDRIGEPQAPASQGVVMPLPVPTLPTTAQPAIPAQAPPVDDQPPPVTQPPTGAQLSRQPAATPPSATSDLAAVVLAERARRAADGSLARSQRRLERKAHKADRLRAKQARLRIGARHRAKDHVRHPDGGHDTVERLKLAGAGLAAKIAAELDSGSRKHLRLPKWIRRVPQLVLGVDFALLLYFFSGITDVDWQSPLSADLAFAVLVAAMVTTLTYGFLAFTGYRLRTYKDHSGAIAHRSLDGLTKAACVAAACGAIGVATLTFIRMRAEVLDALGASGWGTADAIAVILAVVSILANFLVLLIHALDGSDEVARLDAISSNAVGPLVKAHRMREKAAKITFRVNVQRRRAERQAIMALSRAGRYLAPGDQFIEQGADLRPLTTALGHLGSALPEAPPETDEPATGQ